MSFRKRGEVINGGTRNDNSNSIRRSILPNRGGVLPNRGPTSTLRSNIGDSNSNIPGRQPVLSRGPTTSNMSNLDVVKGMNRLNINDENNVGGFSLDKKEQNMKLLMNLNHPGVRPSTVSSHIVSSTGCYDLDKLLSHMGLPLGHSLLIEEDGTTDFQSILSKLFMVQGVIHNRVNKTETVNIQGNTHVIVLSMNQLLGKELPGIYKGSRKEIKKSKIQEEASKLSVSNLTFQETRSQPTRYSDLKIAWKYKYADESSGKKRNVDSNEEDDNDIQSDEYKSYIAQFDITSRLIPAATPQELSFVSPLQPIAKILNQLESLIDKHKNKLIRIVVPSFLHPAMYPPQMYEVANAIGLLHGLRSIVKKFSNRTIMLMTVSKELLSYLLQSQMESLFDGIIDLEPFPQEMLQYLEKIYKSQPNKVQQGLVHLIKLPVFSDRGEMHHRHAEYAFKNSKKSFKIEEWSIPVDDSVDDTDGSNAYIKNDVPSTFNTESTPKRQTKQNLDF